jgi:hypothetical protein
MGAALDSLPAVPVGPVFSRPILPYPPYLPYWILINSTSQTSVPYGGL